MRILIGVLSVISMGIVPQANAMDPPTQSAASTTSSPTADTPPPASAPATADQSSAAKAATTAKGTDGAKVKLVAGDSAADNQLNRLKAAGYKPEMHGEEIVFCRREAVLGSRFERKTCHTAEALDRQTTESQEMANEAQRKSSVSPPNN